MVKIGHLEQFIMRKHHSKILVLDDDQSNAEAIQAVLEEQSFEVSSICSSNELMSSIQKFKPDLIIMDILLDMADGRTLCNQIKVGFQTAHIPVLLITAMLESQVLKVPNRADAIIFKPFDCSSLYRKVSRLIH